MLRTLHEVQKPSRAPGDSAETSGIAQGFAAALVGIIAQVTSVWNRTVSPSTCNVTERDYVEHLYGLLSRSPIFDKDFVTDGVNHSCRARTIQSSGEMLSVCGSDTIEVDPYQKRKTHDMQVVRIRQTT
jgi:hypothetical protein